MHHIGITYLFHIVLLTFISVPLGKEKRGTLNSLKPKSKTIQLFPRAIKPSRRRTTSYGTTSSVCSQGLSRPKANFPSRLRTLSSHAPQTIPTSTYRLLPLLWDRRPLANYRLLLLKPLQISVLTISWMVVAIAEVIRRHKEEVSATTMIQTVDLVLLNTAHLTFDLTF